MNTYQVFVSGLEQPMTVIAKSRSASRYKAYLSLDLDMTFLEFLRCVTGVRLLHPFIISDAFGDSEQFERMKIARGLPNIRLGQKCILHSQNRGDLQGYIVGANSSQNLNVLFPMETDADGNILAYRIENCHPHYRLTFE